MWEHNSSSPWTSILFWWLCSLVNWVPLILCGFISFIGFCGFFELRKVRLPHPETLSIVYYTLTSKLTKSIWKIPHLFHFLDTLVVEPFQYLIGLLEVEINYKITNPKDRPFFSTYRFAIVLTKSVNRLIWLGVWVG